MRARNTASVPYGSSFYRLSIGYSDLPLALLASVACFASFCSFLENAGCNPEQDAVFPAYVPDGFPCGSSTLRQTVWMLRHPSRAFLLSADSSHRCWMFIASMTASLAWLASIAASNTSYRLGQRSLFLCALRIAPAAAAFAQLAFRGPTSSAAYVYRGNLFKMVALVQSANAALGSRALYLVSSITAFLLFLANVYLLSMHGHAPWTLTHMAGAAATTIGAPMVLRACMARWEHRSRHATLGSRGGMPPGGQSTSACGIGCCCKAAPATVEEGVIGEAMPSCGCVVCGPGCRCKAAAPRSTTEGAANKASASTPPPDVPLPLPAPYSVAAPSPVAPVAPAASFEANGSSSSSPLETAATSSQPKGCSSSVPEADGSGSSVPLDDPEKWESVILIRRLLAQPVPEWQPMYTRQRVSVKVCRHPFHLGLHQALLIPANNASVLARCLTTAIPYSLRRSLTMSPSSCPPIGVR